MLAVTYILLVCLVTLSRILLIAFTLAWSKSFSAFLIIFLAFSVFKVDLSLMLTGIKSLWRHLRYKEHLKPCSGIHHHINQTGHTTNQNNFQIIGREGHNLARNIKESIYIRVNNPTLNNNIGKFNLFHIWDRVLLNTKGLTLNNQSNNNNNQLTNPH